jgi:hypothetical protein
MYTIYHNLCKVNGSFQTVVKFTSAINAYYYYCGLKKVTPLSGISKFWAINVLKQFQEDNERILLHAVDSKDYVITVYCD